MSGGWLVSVNVSDGGVPKRPVAECHVARAGLAGDRQRDLRFHGGPDRAVCLYSRERIEALRAEGHTIAAGSAGENLTLAGVPWGEMTPGRRIRVGGALLELTKYAHPCVNLTPFFADGAFVRISEKVNPGWARLYARVLEEGTVRPGDPVDVLG